MSNKVNFIHRICFGGGERNRTVHILLARQNRLNLGTCSPELFLCGIDKIFFAHTVLINTFIELVFIHPLLMFCVLTPIIQTGKLVKNNIIFSYQFHLAENKGFEPSSVHHRWRQISSLFVPMDATLLFKKMLRLHCESCPSHVI
jgi:hypothetical protein